MKPILARLVALLAAAGTLIVAVPASAQWRNDGRGRSSAHMGRAPQQNFRGNRNGFVNRRDFGDRRDRRRDFAFRGRSGFGGFYYDYPSWYGYGYPYDYGYYDYGYPYGYNTDPYAYDPYDRYGYDPYGYDDYPD